MASRVDYEIQAKDDIIDFIERKSVGKEGIVIDISELISAIGRLIDEKLVEASEEQKDVMRDHVEMAVYAAATCSPRQKKIISRSRDLPNSEKAVGEPVRQLSDSEMDEIRQIAAENPWSERGDDGRNPVEWVVAHYGRFIPGLLQGHIGQVDQKLYAAFARHISRKGLPEDLDIPSFAENRLRNTPIEDRGTLLVMRRTRAAEMRALRASKAALGDN